MRIPVTKNKPLSRNDRFAILLLVALIAAVLMCTCALSQVTPATEPHETLLFDAPAPMPVDVAVWAGVRVSAADFVILAGHGGISAHFAPDAPETSKPGESEVVIVLRGGGSDVSRVSSTLTVYRVADVKPVPLGSDLGLLTALDFIDQPVPESDKGRFALNTDLGAIDANVPGRHRVDILLDGVSSPKKSFIELRDEIAPQGKPVRLERLPGDELSPEDFVTDIVDQTEVTVTYITEPDMTLDTEQRIRVLLTDEGGNTTEITSTLILFHFVDDEPPQITGNFHKSIIIGEPALYRAGITVTDNIDESVDLVVDSSAVDTSRAGTYPVIYSATDRSGNKTVVEGSLTVYEAWQDEIEGTLNKALAGIIRDGMSGEQKARAIFNYVKSHLSYGTGTVRDDLQYAAYMAIKTGVGDCYYYYALAQVLLTKAGIENIPIQRVPDYSSRHYWSLVNLGEGWYHFDTTPLASPPVGFSGFMFTESAAQAVTASARIPGYYEYDKSLYPQVVP